MILRKMIGAFIAASLLCSCSMFGLGVRPPAGLADRARAIPGVTGVELAASRPENTGQPVWTSIVRLDPDLDVAGQRAAIADFYRLVDESGKADSYRGGELWLGEDKVLRATDRLDVDNGLLAFLAQLPNYDVQYTRRYAITVAAQIGDINALFERAKALDGLQIPAGLVVKIAVTSAAGAVGGEGYFHFASTLPCPDRDRALRDQLAVLLAGSRVSAATISLDETPIIRVTTPQTDAGLFAALVELAARDDREIRVSAHLPGASQPYQSQTA